MPIPQPFSDDFPLSENFKSRVRDQIEDSKNYYMLGFKPGYALQAQELNELQEIFYIQQTLSLNLISNWSTTSAGTALDLNGLPWNGCTPFSPNLVNYSDSTLTFKVGWYLLKHVNFNAGLAVWIYNNQEQVIENVIAGRFYGIILDDPKVIRCTNSANVGPDEDQELQDDTGYNVINGPCGASRMKINNITFGLEPGTSANFLPIVDTSNTVTFLNSVQVP